METPPDRAVVAQVADAVGPDRLGHLQALAEAARPCGCGVLQRGFVPAALAPGAQHEPGAPDPPVLRVEIAVDLADRGLGHGRQGPDLPARGHPAARECGQPALHRPQVEGVELPLDLDVIVGLRGPLGRRLDHGRRLQRVARPLLRPIEPLTPTSRRPEYPWRGACGG